jgi:hypothetical protein
LSRTPCQHLQPTTKSSVARAHIPPCALSIAPNTPATGRARSSLSARTSLAHSAHFLCAIVAGVSEARCREGGSRSLLASCAGTFDATSSSIPGELLAPHLHRPSAHVCTYSPLACPCSQTLIGATGPPPPRPLPSRRSPRGPAAVPLRAVQREPAGARMLWAVGCGCARACAGRMHIWGGRSGGRVWSRAVAVQGGRSSCRAAARSRAAAQRAVAAEKAGGEAAQARRRVRAAAPCQECDLLCALRTWRQHVAAVPLRDLRSLCTL